MSSCEHEHVVAVSGSGYGDSCSTWCRDCGAFDESGTGWTLPRIAAADPAIAEAERTGLPQRMRNGSVKLPPKPDCPFCGGVHRGIECRKDGWT